MVRIQKKKSEIVIGMVLGFTYMVGRTYKDRQYSGTYAYTESTNENKKPIGILCSWYQNCNALITPLTNLQNTYISISRYKGTIPINNIMVNENKLLLSEVVVRELKALCETCSETCKLKTFLTLLYENF